MPHSKILHAIVLRGLLALAVGPIKIAKETLDNDRAAHS